MQPRRHTVACQAPSQAFFPTHRTPGCQALWPMPLISAFQKWRREDQEFYTLNEFEASLSHLCLCFWKETTKVRRTKGRGWQTEWQGTTQTVCHHLTDAQPSPTPSAAPRKQRQ